MGKSPSQFEETIQHQFDRLCKLALKGEKNRLHTTYGIFTQK